MQLFLELTCRSPSKPNYPRIPLLPGRGKLAGCFLQREPVRCFYEGTYPGVLAAAVLARLHLIVIVNVAWVSCVSKPDAVAMKENGTGRTSCTWKGVRKNMEEWQALQTVLEKMWTWHLLETPDTDNIRCSGSSPERMFEF